MSFPNIPDITPEISITFEDAIILLLASIALEEMSLSELMDVEKNKILYVLKEFKHKDTTLQDVIDINKSVDDTIKTLIKMQMLLQFKLENIIKVLPTTTAHTKASTTPTCSTTTKKECGCSIMGKGKGRVTNECDEFFCQIAEIQAFAFSRDSKSRFVRYSVKNDDESLCMTASSYNVKLECPSENNIDKIEIHGKGHVEKKSECHPPIVGTVNFVMKIYRHELGKIAIKMEIWSDHKPELCHDSGLINIKNIDQEFKISSFC